MEEVKKKASASPRITPIKWHYRRRGNNSEIVAVLIIILLRPEQQVERQKINSMPTKRWDNERRKPGLRIDTGVQPAFYQ